MIEFLTAVCSHQ